MVSVVIFKDNVIVALFIKLENLKGDMIRINIYKVKEKIKLSYINTNTAEMTSHKK